MKKQFKLSSELYSNEKINEAISDFSEITEITYNNWILEIIWESESDIEEVFNEFMNYCIWLIND